MARRAKGSGFSMRSGKKTSFKNMGSTSLNRTGYGNMSDGRSKSSPFQNEGWKEVWDEETKTYKKVPVEGGTQEIIATKQTGKATRQKPHVSSWAEACKDKTSGIGTDSTGKEWDCSRKKDWKPSDEVETKDLLRESETEKFIPKEKEKPKGKKRICKCRGQSQYLPGGTGTSTSSRGWEVYPCGHEGDGTNPSDYQKHPNCIRRTKEQRIANAERDAVYSGGLGHDQGAYSDKERKEAGINFEGKYLGEGKGAEFHKDKGYSQSVRERTASKKKYKELYKALKGGMSDRQWKKYIKNNPGWQAELRAQAGVGGEESFRNIKQW